MDTIEEKIITLAAFLFVFVLIIMPTVQARPSFQPQVKPLETCLVCHENKGGGGPLNSFGKDWEAGGMKLEKIAKLDSDGDGFDNATEIADKTLPGNPNSNRDAKPPYLLIIGSVLLGAGLITLFIIAAIRAKKREEDEKKTSQSSETDI